MRARLLSIVPAIAIVVLIAAVFAPVRSFEFVNYDDFDFIVDNPHVAGGLTTASVRWAYANAYRATGGPVPWMSHMADASMFGLDPGAHHVVNVVLHMVASILLFVALMRMTGKAGESAFVAALFAIHPAHVESVAWVSERKDVLAAIATFATILAYARYARQRSTANYLWVTIAFLFALMCKPITVTLPLTLMLLDVWPLKRWGGWIEKIPLLAMSAIAGVLVLRAQQAIGAVAGVDRVSFGQRASNATVSLVAYLGKAVWPMQLSPYYPYRDAIPIATVAACGIALVAITVVAIAAIRRAPYVTVGWLWYLITMLPLAGLIQVGGHAMADRFTYIPFIGLFIIVAWGTPAIVRPRMFLPVAAIVVVLVAAAAARGEVSHWRTSVDLWQHAVDVNPANERAHANLGVALARAGDSRGAMAEYMAAVQLQPNDPYAQNNLGLLLAEQERSDDALSHYYAAITAWPEYANAHNNLANLLADRGRFDEAIEHHREAIRLNSDDALAYFNLAVTLAQMGRLSEALTQVDRALILKPDFADARAMKEGLLGTTR